MTQQRSPVPVLVHGFLGFVRIGPLDYFRGVGRALRAMGIEPLIPRLPYAGTIAERAGALARALRDHGAASFVLLGHSMGGLDGRYVIANLDPDRRVRRLVTVATPHLGSVVARRLLEDPGPVARAARGLWRSALTDLDPRTREREPIPDRPDVHYASYAAFRPHGEIAGPIRFIAGSIDEDNDGLVPAASARWGEFRGTLRADHLELVGWSLAPADRASARPFDHISFWCQTVAASIAFAEGVNHGAATAHAGP